MGETLDDKLNRYLSSHVEVAEELKKDNLQTAKDIESHITNASAIPKWCTLDILLLFVEQDLKDHLQKKHIPTESIFQLVKRGVRNVKGLESVSAVDEGWVTGDLLCVLLDQDVQDLLKSMRPDLTRISAVLVRNYMFSLQQLALGLIDKRKEFNEKDAALLDTPLKLRGKLLKKGITDNALIDKLCAKFSTFTDFQRQPWSVLDPLVSTPRDKTLVQALWEEDDPLRTAAKKYQLQPSIVDKLEQKGITALNDVDPKTISGIIDAETDLSTKAKLNDLLTKESDVYKRGEEDREKKRKDYEERTKQAKEMTAQLKKEVGEDFAKVKESIKGRMEAIHKQLAVTNWQWDEAKLKDPQTLIKDLTTLEGSLSQTMTQFTVPADATNVSDQAWIEMIEAGLALKGFLLGISWEEPLQNARTKALKPPEGVRFELPSIDSKQETFMESTAEAFAGFKKTIDNSGYSIAAGMSASGYGFTAGASASHGKSTSEIKEEKSKRLTTFVSTSVIFRSVHRAFRIPRSMMSFNEEALTALREIGTDALKARDFLYDFGSHFYTGYQHVGGLFIKHVTAETEEQMKASTLEKVVATETSARASGGGSYGGFGGSFDVSTAFFDEKGTHTGTQSDTKSAKITSSITMRGPSTNSLDLFLKVLETNRSKWRIIDRGPDLRQKVAVWSLVAKLHPDLKATAVILRDQWVSLAQQGAVILPDVKEELDRAKNENLSEPPKEGDLQAGLVRLAGLLESIKLDDFTATEVFSATRNYVTSLLALSEDFPSKNIVFEAMRLTALPAFLARLLQGPSKKVTDSLYYLKNFFDYNGTFYKLQEEGVAILPDVARYFMPQKREGYKPPQDVRPEQLPNELDIIVNMYQGNKELNVYELNESLALLLKTAVTSGDEWAPLKTILHDYGWRGDSFAQILQLATVKVLIAQLRDPAATPEQPPKPNPNADFDEYVFWVQMSKKSMAYLIVDRSMDSAAEDPPKYLTDTLRHRMDIALPKSTPTEPTKPPVVDPWADLDEKTGESGDKPAPTATKPAIVHLSNVFQTLDLVAMSDFENLLLERRSAAIFARQRTPSPQPYECYARALTDIVTTSMSKDKVCLVSDSKLLRIVTLSVRDQAKSEMNNFLLRALNVQPVDASGALPADDSRVIVELAMGFVPINQSLESAIVLNIRGGFPADLWPLVARFADVVFVEGNPAGIVPEFAPPAGSTEKVPRVLVWTPGEKVANPVHSAKAVPFRHLSAPGNIDDAVVVARNLFSAIPEAIKGEDERRIKEGKEKLVRQSLFSIVNSLKDLLFVETDASNFDLKEVENYPDFHKVRSQFALQISFEEEAKLAAKKNSAINKNNGAAQQAIQYEIDKQRAYRREVSPKMQDHKLVQALLAALSLKFPDERGFAVKRLESVLGSKSASSLANLKLAVDEAWSKKQSVKQTDPNYAAVMQKWYQAQLDYNSGLVVIEHVLREVSHMYVANPAQFIKVPYSVLAARHLLDGFPLELMDGDAGSVNLEWMQAVLLDVQRAIHADAGYKKGSAPLPPSRIFVLSVMGTQSCGKSTLLNIMFGVKFRTSVGRCTRGINIQLLRTEGRSDYDYVLLLDTEGIRAPEFALQGDADWRDNRIATFSILPADTTIIMINGEQHNTITEILPIVLSAYRDSKLTEGKGLALSTLLFFVYTRIDIKNAAQLEDVQKSLIDQLQKSFNIIQDVRSGDEPVTPSGPESGEPKPKPGSSSDLPVTEFLTGFTPDFKDNSKSDIRVMGKNQIEYMPPNDRPDTAYGASIMQLREHIHGRIAGYAAGKNKWQAKTLAQFSSYLADVWECLESSDFHFNFRNAIDRHLFAQLQAQVTNGEREVSLAFAHAYQKQDQKLVLGQITAPNPEDAATQCVDAMLEEANVVVVEYRDKLWKTDTSDASKSKSEAWRDQMQQRWDVFVTHTVNYWKVQMRRRAESWLGSERQLGIELAAVREWSRQSSLKFSSLDETQRQAEFDKHFKEVTDEVASKFPPQTMTLEGRVSDIYSSHADIAGTITLASKKFQQIADIWTRQRGNESVLVTQLLEALLPDKAQLPSHQTLFRDLTQKTKSILDGATMYKESYVYDAIPMTEKIVKDSQLTGPVVREVSHQLVYAILVTQLREISMKFDAENGLLAKVINSKKDLVAHFMALCKGNKGAMMLIPVAASIVENNWWPAYEEFLKFNLSHIMIDWWVFYDTSRMRAFLDLKLCALLREGKKSEVVEKLTSEKQYRNELIMAHIKDKMAANAKDLYPDFRARINQAFESAAKVQGEKPLDLYLNKLKQNLAGFSTKLAERVGPELADPQDLKLEFVNPSVFQSITEEQRKKLPETFPADRLIGSSLLTTTVQEIQNKPTSAGVKPRCDAECYYCKSPCILEINHHPTTKHDCEHQPLGIGGTTYWIDGDYRLPFSTCWEYYEKDAQFTNPWKGNFKKDWSRAHPAWEHPKKMGNLSLREYAFWTCLPEFGAHFSKAIPSTGNMPDRIKNRKIEDIERELNELLVQRN